MTNAPEPSLDQVFQALADPTRRGLVAILVRGPASVSSLARPFDMTLSAVMQHLQVLIDSGLVRTEKVGRVRTCRIDAAGLRRAEDWLARRRTLWEHRLERLDLLLTAPSDRTGRLDMTDRSVLVSSFAVERTYPLGPEAVFAAWADPGTKARWFAGANAEHHELDFRPGGVEVTRGRSPEGRPLTFESRYHDIVPAERIVYSSALLVEQSAVTISVTTVQFRPSGGGTTLVLTEQDTYLDGHEQPEMRESGTRGWLDALGRELAATVSP
ncbi:metalloregulator ArsR/SmtB family transcription factor [Micromonospora zhanjiangensis]|uniref:Metalloregulator ArsR/SmtB family transcription factor n=1 Tax=Micromonospora zhanjiangensis TaxID=1522057 RepID=A0ABV8KQI8_9ACTN